MIALSVRLERPPSPCFLLFQEILLFDIRTGTRYNNIMIRTFKHQGLKRLYERGDRSELGRDQLEVIEDILAILDVAVRPQDLNLPGYNLHPLKGKLKGFWSVKVSANWRIIFRIEDGDARDIDLIDYH